MNKTFPSDGAIVFLICEDIREEAGGKLSFMGAFTGGTLGIPLDTDVDTAAVAGLSVFLAFTDGQGQFDGRFRLLGPSKEVIVDHERPLVKEDGGWLNVIANFRPFKLRGIGTYTVEATMDDHVYTRTFDVAFDKAAVGEKT